MNSPAAIPSLRLGYEDQPGAGASSTSDDSDKGEEGELAAALRRVAAGPDKCPKTGLALGRRPPPEEALDEFGCVNVSVKVCECVSCTQMPGLLMHVRGLAVTSRGLAVVGLALH